MGDVLNFVIKSAAEAEAVEESVQIMMCGHCQNAGFFLATDGRLFCVNCREQVDATWGVEEGDPDA